MFALRRYALPFDALPFRRAEGPRCVVGCPLRRRRRRVFCCTHLFRIREGNRWELGVGLDLPIATIATTIASCRSRLGPKSSDKEHAWNRPWEAVNWQTVRRGRERKDIVHCGHTGSNGIGRGCLACSTVGIGIGRPKLSIAMRTHLWADNSPQGRPVTAASHANLFRGIGGHDCTRALLRHSMRSPCWLLVADSMHRCVNDVDGLHAAAQSIPPPSAPSQLLLMSVRGASSKGSHRAAARAMLPSMCRCSGERRRSRAPVAMRLPYCVRAGSVSAQSTLKGFNRRARLSRAPVVTKLGNRFEVLGHDLPNARAPSARTHVAQARRQAKPSQARRGEAAPGSVVVHVACFHRPPARWATDRRGCGVG